MPSIASAPPSPVPNSKKRRRDGHSSTASAYIDASAMSFEMQLEIAITARHVLPPLVSKRQTDGNSPHLSRHDPATVDKLYGDLASQRPQLFPRSRTKRQRPSGSFETWKAIEDKENGSECMGKDGDGRLDVKEERAVRESKVDLRPCHICYRRPSSRRELDEYGDCEACEMRTCYICIRQCDGLGMQWDRRDLYEGEGIFDGTGEHDGLVRSGKGRNERNTEVERRVGHQSKVCSRCCVERGADGEVRCMGCLRDEEGD